MITLILGNKGSGKTKRLLNMCAAATEASNGSVVFIEKDSTLTFDLSHKTRLAVAEELTPQAPLVLDDAFVRFDDDRLKETLKLLKQSGEHRQVILFTCQSREQKIMEELS